MTTVDFYDAFENLLNARSLASATPLPFSISRPPLLAVLHAPLQKLLDVAAAGPDARIWAPHLLQALIGVACVAAVYQWLRRYCTAGWAHLGAILFSLNRMTIHYFSSAMPDLPCALLVTLTFLSIEGEGWAWRSTALLLGGCLLCRWNLLLLVPWIVLVSRKRRAAVLAALGAVASFFGVCVLVFWKALGVGLGEALRILLQVLAQQAANNSRPESYRAYVESLIASGGILQFALFVAGGLAVVVRKDRKFLRQPLFFAYFFAIMTFMIGHKESRYLLPLVPCYVLLALRGLQEASGRLAERWRGLVVGTALAASAVGAAVELRQFADPVYRSSVLRDVCRVIEENKPDGGRVYWKGFAHALAPKERVFTRTDAYYYVFHIPSQTSLEYLLGESIETLTPAASVTPGDLVVQAPERRFNVGEAPRFDDNRMMIWKAASTSSLRPLARLD